MPKQRLLHRKSGQGEKQSRLARQNKKHHSPKLRHGSRLTHRDFFHVDTWRLFARNIGEFLAEVLEPGCCLGFPIVFFGAIGIMSGMLIWHSFLLGMPIGGGTALVIGIFRVRLALAH